MFTFYVTINYLKRCELPCQWCQQNSDLVAKVTGKIFMIQFGTFRRFRIMLCYTIVAKKMFLLTCVIGQPWSES